MTESDQQQVTIEAFLTATFDEWTQDLQADRTRMQPELREWLLASIAKDRAILALHYSLDADLKPYCAPCDTDDYPCQTVRLLAAPYGGHPGYRDSWKPQAS